MNPTSTDISPTTVSQEIAPALEEVLSGLGARQKTLPSKLFYDERGSGLFDDICTLDEYYVTRVETGLMKEHAPEIARLLGPSALVVEYGGGNGAKTRSLLDHLESPAGYVPIDISSEYLAKIASNLAFDYP